MKNNWVKDNLSIVSNKNVISSSSSSLTLPPVLTAIPPILYKKDTSHWMLILRTVYPYRENFRISD